MAPKALLALALLAAPLLVACGSGGRATTRDARLEKGAKVYRVYCALCHGDALEGYAADDANQLRNQLFLQTVTDDFLRVAIQEGHPGTAMAAYSTAYGGPLDDKQVEALVAFIRSHQEEPSLPVHDLHVEGDASRGAPVYAERCASCHGARGEGLSGVSLNNPVFHDTASDGQLKVAIELGRPGTPMPAFGDTLSRQTIDDLVAFTRALRQEGPPRPRVQQVSLDQVDVVINRGGPDPYFTLREDRFVPAAQVADALAEGAKLVILDARPTSDWLAFHIPGAVPTPYYAVEEIISKIPRDGTFIVAYCGCPHAASGQVVDALRRAGFENTAIIDEGIFHWRDAGYPLVVGDP